MQSSPGSLSPQTHPAVSLAILALVALGVSLMLAIAALPRARIETPVVRHSVVATPASRPIAVPPSATVAERPMPLPKIRAPRAGLEPLLFPWAIGVDALAVAGLGIVIFVRWRART